MSKLSAIVSTKGNLNGTINSSVKTKGTVSVGGVLIGAEMAKRGLPGAKGDQGDTGEKGDTGAQGPQGIQGEQGIQGIQGEQGDKGDKGNRGFSFLSVSTQPTNMSASSDYPHRMPTATIKAEAGVDDVYVGDIVEFRYYHYPVAYIDDTYTWMDARYNIRGPQGLQGEKGDKGDTGVDGADGYSPSASVSKSGSIATITITDKNGTTTASVSDGSGVPTGGTSGQVLTKHSATDYDVLWEDPSGSTITDVTVDGISIVDDGVAELETVTQLRDGLMVATDKQKLDGIASGAEVNVNADWDAVSGDAQILNKPTIPSKTSDLNNDSGFITTETDPIFTASDAYGIDSTDITNWDNSYDGKVSLDTSAQSGTTDGDLYAAIVALGWSSDVIE